MAVAPTGSFQVDIAIRQAASFATASDGKQGGAKAEWDHFEGSLEEKFMPQPKPGRIGINTGRSPRAISTHEKPRKCGRGRRRRWHCR